MRTLILAAVAAVALVGCPQHAKTEPTDNAYRPETTVTKIVDDNGYEQTFISFQPTPNRTYHCTYMQGQPASLSCTDY